MLTLSRNQLLDSFLQPLISLSISDLPPVVPVTSFSRDSPLSPSITLSLRHFRLETDNSFPPWTHFVPRDCLHGLRIGSDLLFWATIWETVRSMPSDRCLCVCLSVLSVRSVCPVCDVGVLLPNGLMDQDETWHGGKPRPWPHCVIRDPASPPQRGTAPIFGPCMLWPQAEWIKMPLGTKVGLGPSHVVLDGDPAPPPR